ncbi:MAG: hypothetical protein AAGL90_07460 [Pseudomonadota bacterium]
MAGVLPFFGLFIPAQSIFFYISQAVLLGTGSVGLASLFFGFRFIQDDRAGPADRPPKSYIGILTIYTSFWLITFYCLSVFF